MSPHRCPAHPEPQDTRSAPRSGRPRVDLAAAYRLVALFKWDDLVFTHISARVPGRDDAVPDQPLRPDVRGDHRVEPGQGRPAGQQARRLAVPGQPGRLHDPQRDPRGAPRRAVRAAHAYAERRRGVGAEAAACCRCRSSRSSCCRAWAITTTKASRCATTRSRAWCATSGRQQLPDAAQSRPADGRRHGGRRVPGHVPVRDRLHDPGPRPGRRRRADPGRPAHHRRRASSRRRRSRAGQGGGALAWPGLLRRLDRTDPGYDT